MARAHSATSHVRPSRLGSSVRKTPGKRYFIYAQYDKKIVKLSKGQIVNANTELIPEAPNRQPKTLIVGVSESIATAVVQVAVPGIACIFIRRTPPVTEAANAVVISIVVAVTARNSSK